ncbi:hypothetical protein [Thermoanaerobacterium thermosaccharolyticum]|uniref:hypothetical protein n=1 Tax=Thermoanaerobacterium thermosaccharolyticum TaxID=1517 RepID=UPI003DA83381
MRVLTNAGHTALTRIPRPAYSTAAVFVRAMTAAFYSTSSSCNQYNFILKSH